MVPAGTVPVAPFCRAAEGHDDHVADSFRDLLITPWTDVGLRRHIWLYFADFRAETTDWVIDENWFRSRHTLIIRRKFERSCFFDFGLSLWGAWRLQLCDAHLSPWSTAARWGLQ